MIEISKDGRREPPGSAFLDQIYELLGGIEEDLQSLKRDFGQNAKADVNVAVNIRDAVHLLVAWEYSGRLGISETDIRKFERMSGHMNVSVMRKVGERARSLLKELEGDITKQLSRAVIAEDIQSNVSPASPAPSKAISIRAQVWIPINRRKNSQLLSDISELLDEAIVLSKSSNLPPNERVLSEIERAQLIALLETALHVLRAPLVEKGLLEKLTTAAKAGAASAVQKKTELALGFGLGKLAELLIKLLGGLS